MSHHQAMDALTTDGTAWIEMGVAFVVYFMASFLWWGPLLGKRWAREMGMDPQMRPDSRAMGTAMVLQAVGTAALTYVLWHVMHAFTVGFDAGAPVRIGPTMGQALFGATMVWAGFFVPVQLGRVAWERASWSLFAINAGGHLVALLLMGATFALL